MLVRLFQDVANFIYPPCCVCCRSATNDSAFCCKCGEALSELAAAPACDRCGAPLPLGSACPRCAGAGIHPFGKIVALGPFRDPLRKIIHGMKYHYRWSVAEILADQMLAQERIGQVLDETEVLVPIPLHWSRQIWRGYNQADCLARRLAHHRGSLRVGYPIVRLKNTASQTMVRSIADRDANLSHAFGLVDSKSIRHKRITLVDDVVTTGSTLKAAARAMAQAAPATINVLVLAVADPRRRDFQAV
ncbi:MAG: phosphoribosyltransferase family protein [Tepidisphaeraceae bacterium]